MVVTTTTATTNRKLEAGPSLVAWSLAMAVLLSERDRCRPGWLTNAMRILIGREWGRVVMGRGQARQTMSEAYASSHWWSKGLLALKCLDLAPIRTGRSLVFEFSSTGYHWQSIANDHKPTVVRKFDISDGGREMGNTRLNGTEIATTATVAESSSSRCG